jgi:L-asparaginase / beta-aspartyl-peptidase
VFSRQSSHPVEMPRAIPPVLIAHGGAGSLAAPADRPGRRRALLDAVTSGATILRQGGSALDAVIAAVVVLEDDPLFNAGYGSVLTVDGRAEMDAGVMTAERLSKAAASANARSRAPSSAAPRRQSVRIRAGGVVTVSRVRNPILLARAVMESTPHVLLGGAGAEAFARRVGIKLCRPADLISQRARERWLARSDAAAVNTPASHGTVGAAASDCHGNLAAATSTGGVAGKIAGRIGDSAIIGAGLYATAAGAASATGTGEAIMRMASCRAVVESLLRADPSLAAASAIGALRDATAAEAGLIVIDRHGRIGFAHNTAAMEIAILDATGSITHLMSPALASPQAKPNL